MTAVFRDAGELPAIRKIAHFLNVEIPEDNCRCFAALSMTACLGFIGADDRRPEVTRAKTNWGIRVWCGRMVWWRGGAFEEQPQSYLSRCDTQEDQN
jgi:hypothetical protein